MKKNMMVVFLFSLVIMMLFNGCAQPVEVIETEPAAQPQMYLVPDNPLGEDEYDPKIYEINPNVPYVHIPDESVPLAADFDTSDGISEREAESIAIAHAGLTNDDVQFLHSRYVDDSQEVETPYYHVEFRSQTAPHRFWIDAASGEILLYEQNT